MAHLIAATPRITLIATALVSMLIGAIFSYWFWSAQAESLAIIDATTKVKVHANLLRQLEAGDIEGAKAANRSLMRTGGAALNVLAPAGYKYVKDTDVIEALQTVAALPDEGGSK